MIVARTQQTRELAVSRLEQWIEQNRVPAQDAVRRVFERVPQDFLVPAPRLHIEPVKGRSGVRAVLNSGDGETEFALHRNAIDQLSERVSMPTRYAHTLLDEMGERGADIFSYAANRTLAASQDRFLVRATDSRLMAVLSDRFRRIDCRPALEALLTAAQDAGAIVGKAHQSDLRTEVKLIVPEVREWLPGEFGVLGVAWHNSDFGRGANEIRSFMMRLRCVNGMVGASVMREVHIGGRLMQGVEYQDRTLELDSEATASAIRDVGRHIFTELPRQLEAKIQAAAGTEIDLDDALKSLRKDLTKGEFEEAGDVLRSVDIERLPPGNTRWRLSNAISWLANQSVDSDRSIELQRLAGKVLEPAGAGAID